MKKLIGNKINVFFKSGDEMSGVLEDITNYSVYIRLEELIYVIPKVNISYYSYLALDFCEAATEPELSVPKPTSIKVYINGDLISDIPTPPTCKLDVWNDQISKIIFNNSDVQSALGGKIQRAIDYWPGIVKITVDEGRIEEPTKPNNVFNISDSDVTTKYLSPTQMVGILSRATKIKE